MSDVFEELAQNLDVLPEELEKMYQQSVIEEVDKDAEKLTRYFLANSGSETLNSNMFFSTTKIEGKLYIRTVDWNDKTPVNVMKGKSYGRDANKPRNRGKRNYSIRPATTRDLAYIINYGQVKNGKTRTLGNYFITKGMRRVKNRDKRIKSNFNRKILLIAKKFE